MASPEPTLPAPIFPRRAPLLGPTTSASLLIGTACAVGVLDAWSAWHRRAVVTEYAAGAPGVWVADLTSADATGRAIGLLYVMAILAAAGSVLVWLSRVRANARLLGGPEWPRRMPWVVGGWYAACLVALVLAFPVSEAPDGPGLAALAVADTVSVVLLCVAGVLAVPLVREVSRAQAA